MKPKQLRQLCDEKIVSIIKTNLGIKWVRIWLEHGNIQSTINNFLQMEQEIRQAIKLLRNPSIIPQCFKNIQESTEGLQEMAEDIENLGQDTSLIRKIRPGLARWYSREVSFEQIWRQYEDKAKNKNRKRVNLQLY